jgi:hypothetical protein
MQSQKCFNERKYQYLKYKNKTGHVTIIGYQFGTKFKLVFCAKYDRDFSFNQNKLWTNWRSKGLFYTTNPDYYRITHFLSLIHKKVMIKKMFTFVLFGFPNFWLWAYMYLIKVISETYKVIEVIMSIHVLLTTCIAAYMYIQLPKNLTDFLL